MTYTTCGHTRGRLDNVHVGGPCPDCRPATQVRNDRDHSDPVEDILADQDAWTWGTGRDIGCR